MDGAFSPVGTLIDVKTISNATAGINLTPGLIYEIFSPEIATLSIPYGEQKPQTGDNYLPANVSFWHYAKVGRSKIDVVSLTAEVYIREYEPIWKKED